MSRNSKEIVALCLDWHIDKSEAFLDLLVQPLRSYSVVSLRAWGGKTEPASIYKEPVVIFCMLPPSENFLKNYKGQIIWIPMWDQAQGYSQQWWSELPKRVRIVSFSNAIHRKANIAGLKSLHLKYYKDPESFKQVSWEDGNTIFYWNRTGLINREFLEKFCSSISASKILFRDQLDPRIDKKLHYELPNKLGHTRVINVKANSRESYLRAINEANIFIAPRAREGAGMTFMEAMARGCAVIANNEPTMNEYIISGKNGLLLDHPNISSPKLFGLFTRKSSNTTASIHQLAHDSQNWQRMAKLNFRKLGDRARLDSQTGYDNWIQSIPKYAEFIKPD